MVMIVVAGLLLVAVLAAVAVVARAVFQRAVAQLAAHQAAETDAAVAAALDHVDRLNRSHLEGRSAAIGAGLDAVRSELRHELDRLGKLVAQVGEASASRFGRVDEALRLHADVTGKLAASTSTLREALASPQARGRWGERMAEDVLRLAGFVENVNYRKQVTVAGQDGTKGRPDFAFDLPKGHVLYMDVKFPLASYLRYLDATTDPERVEYLKGFLRDVRARVKELADRSYGRDVERRDGATSLDYVLLFLPNEQLSGFIHEHDPDLLDDALRQRVVMCSPLTLFAFLGVIRQAFDNFVIEQTSDEILALVGSFQQQWRRYVDSADKVKRHFQQVHAEFEHLTSTRERAVERPLRELDELRQRRAVVAATGVGDPGDAHDPGVDESGVDGAGVTPALRVVERGH
jgi:DNA recombination protein RmuC